MTPRCFKCTRFRKGILDFSLKCIQLLQNDFFKQRYITFNATIPGQDRINPNTHLCRTLFAGYTCITFDLLIIDCPYFYKKMYLHHFITCFTKNSRVGRKYRYAGIPRYYFGVVRTAAHLPVPRYSCFYL